MSRKAPTVLPDALARGEYFRTRAASRSPSRRPPRKGALNGESNGNSNGANGVLKTSPHENRLPQIASPATSDKSDKSLNGDLTGEVTISLIDYRQPLPQTTGKRTGDQMHNIKIFQYIGQGKNSSRTAHEFWMQNGTASKFPVAQQTISSRAPLNFAIYVDGQFFQRLSVCCLNKLRTNHQIIGSKLFHFKVVDVINVVLCYRCKGHEYMKQSLKKGAPAPRSLSVPRRALLAPEPVGNGKERQINGLGEKRSRSISKTRNPPAGQAAVKKAAVASAAAVATAAAVTAVVQNGVRNEEPKPELEETLNGVEDPVIKADREVLEEDLEKFCEDRMSPVAETIENASMEMNGNQNLESEGEASAGKTYNYTSVTRPSSVADPQIQEELPEIAQNVPEETIEQTENENREPVEEPLELADSLSGDAVESANENVVEQEPETEPITSTANETVVRGSSVDGEVEKNLEVLLEAGQETIENEANELGLSEPEKAEETSEDVVIEELVNEEEPKAETEPVVADESPPESDEAVLQEEVQVDEERPASRLDVEEYIPNSIGEEAQLEAMRVLNNDASEPPMEPVVEGEQQLDSGTISEAIEESQPTSDDKGETQQQEPQELLIEEPEPLLTETQVEDVSPLAAEAENAEQERPPSAQEAAAPTAPAGADQVLWPDMIPDAQEQNHSLDEPNPAAQGFEWPDATDTKPRRTTLSAKTARIDVEILPDETPKPESDETPEYDPLPKDSEVTADEETNPPVPLDEVALKRQNSMHRQMSVSESRPASANAGGEVQEAIQEETIEVSASRGDLQRHRSLEHASNAIKLEKMNSLQHDSGRRSSTPHSAGELIKELGYSDPEEIDEDSHSRSDTLASIASLTPIRNSLTESAMGHGHRHPHSLSIISQDSGHEADIDENTKPTTPKDASEMIAQLGFS